MNAQIFRTSTIVLLLLAIVSLPAASSAKDIVRPEEIRSMRQVVYDKDTYSELASQWKAYYDAYPSEFSYANWMYAARYAGDKKYEDLLTKGVEMYPANPVLLYLKGLEYHGKHDNTEGRRYLEKAVALDPSYMDPWFALVTEYMDQDNQEKLDIALRHLLESGIITDVVMDFNYNMLISLEPNAILLTNGDNDTYPGWILTRLMKVRPDVGIVNRSLLNSEWYPLRIIEHGMPRFIGQSELNDLRDAILKKLREAKAPLPAGGPFADTLIQLLIQAADRAGRPVYFAKTLYVDDKLAQLAEKGRELGLVELVSPLSGSYKAQLRKVVTAWIDSFRTGGLDGWRLRNAPEADAGRMLATNYGPAAVGLLDALNKNAPELRHGFFNWYTAHAESILPEKLRYNCAQEWCCKASDISEVVSWCRKQGIECEDQSKN